MRWTWVIHQSENATHQMCIPSRVVQGTSDIFCWTTFYLYVRQIAKNWGIMGDHTRAASSQQQQHLLRIPNVAPDDVESGAIRSLSCSDDNSSVRSASPAATPRRVRKPSAPLPPLLMPTLLSGQPPPMPPPDPDPGDSETRHHHPQFQNHLKRTSTAGMSNAQSSR
jgi:hypothetical protein